MKWERVALPIGERSIQLAGYWKIGTLIRVLCGQRLVDFDS